MTEYLGEFVGCLVELLAIDIFKSYHHKSGIRRIVELTSYRHLFFIKLHIVVSDDVKYHRMLRLVCLYYDLTFVAFSSGATAHLFHQLEAAFVGAEVGEGKHIVSIEDSHHFHRVEVEAFGHHLRSYEYVSLFILKLFQYVLVAVFRACGVEVEARAVSLREYDFQVVFDAFCSEAVHLEVCAAA